MIVPYERRRPSLSPLCSILMLGEKAITAGCEPGTQSSIAPAGGLPQPALGSLNVTSCDSATGSSSISLSAPTRPAGRQKSPVAHDQGSATLWSASWVTDKPGAAAPTAVTSRTSGWAVANCASDKPRSARCATCILGGRRRLAGDSRTRGTRRLPIYAASRPSWGGAGPSRRVHHRTAGSWNRRHEPDRLRCRWP